MKRSEAVRIMVDKINEDQYVDYGVYDYQVSDALSVLENKIGLKIKYINPEALIEFGDIIEEKGEIRGYIHYIDKYPEHHFLKGRPYEFYLEGWEPEDE